jgi:arylsulfatase
MALAAGMIIPFLTASAAPSRPNVVLIVADDMGFSDAGCYGGEIQTPNLDLLAKGGLRFTQFYNTARCWPSRAAFLTGYYAQQVRRDTIPGLGGGAGGVRPRWARLLPELLRPLGYHSYHSGKWHLDGKVLAGGFEHSYSFNDHNRYFSPREHTLDDESLPPVKTNSGYYATTAIAQHAIDFLTSHHKHLKNEPFFLYLAFTAPHFPLHALPEDFAFYKERYRNGWDAARSERYDRVKKMGILNCALGKLDPDIIPRWNLSQQQLSEQIGPGEIGQAIPWNSLTGEQKEFQPLKMALHAAMIHRMDIEIGRVLAQLETMDAWSNTAIFFLSDNGASAEQIIRGDLHDRTAAPGSPGTFLSIGPGWAGVANTPFRLHKSWVHEGGISTPLIVHWPDGISARGELRHNPGHVIDLAPTILQLAGGKWPSSAEDILVPPSPGRSLVPVFDKDFSVGHEYFWWFHEGNRAIRVGDWKLVADHEKPWELYDLSKDRAESNDLALAQPEKVKELEKTWEARLEEFRSLAAKNAGNNEKNPSKRSKAN